MKPSNKFTKAVVTVGPQSPLSKAAQLMDEHNVGAIVVAEQGRPVGIVTDRDLALAVCAKGLSRDEHVQQDMTCPVTTIKQSDGVFKATQHMMEASVRRLPVVDDSGRLVGLVSLDDLLLLLSGELQNMAEGVRPEMAAD
jgi:CBS domain-containing protein